MEPNHSKIIKICMGSSCYARGNTTNLNFIENYIKKWQLDASIELYGSRCENRCEQGPNVIIDETKFSNATIETIENALDDLKLKNGGTDE